MNAKRSSIERTLIQRLHSDGWGRRKLNSRKSFGGSRVIIKWADVKLTYSQKVIEIQSNCSNGLCCLPKVWKYILQHWSTYILQCPFTIHCALFGLKTIWKRVAQQQHRNICVINRRWLIFEIQAVSRRFHLLDLMWASSSLFVL